MPKQKETFHCKCDFFCEGKPEFKEHICKTHLESGKKKDKLKLLLNDNIFNSYLKQTPIINPKLNFKFKTNKRKATEIELKNIITINESPKKKIKENLSGIKNMIENLTAKKETLITNSFETKIEKSLNNKIDVDEKTLNKIDEIKNIVDKIEIPINNNKNIDEIMNKVQIEKNLNNNKNDFDEKHKIENKYDKYYKNEKIFLFDEEINKEALDQQNFLLDDEKLLCDLNVDDKSILIKALDILTKSIDKKIKNQDADCNELNFKNFEKNISGTLLFFIKKLLINQTNSSTFKFINNNETFKTLYKKLTSCCFISNQICNCRNKKVDSCNLKKNFTIFLKFSGLSNKAIKNLSRIGLCTTEEVEKIKQVEEFNIKKLEQIKIDIEKQFLLLISDNKFFMNKNPILDETHKKEVIHTTKTVTKVFRVPDESFVKPDEKLKLQNNFQKLKQELKNKLNINDKEIEKNIILNNITINKEEELEFSKLMQLMLCEVKKNKCDLNFYKNDKTNHSNDETSKTFIINSSLCGDDSAEDNFKVFQDFIKYFNENAKTNFDTENFHPFVEVDGKGYAAFRKLINDNKINVHLCPGTFHMVVNIMKVK
jgi:hypothetical protein